MSAARKPSPDDLLTARQIAVEFGMSTKEAQSWARRVAVAVQLQRRAPMVGRDDVDATQRSLP